MRNHRFTSRRSLKLIAWALGTTSLAAGALSTSAQASSCSTFSSDMGGTSLSEPDDIGTICATSSISTVADSTPRYWEFNWGGTSARETITGSVSGLGSFEGFPAEFVKTASTSPQASQTPTGSFTGSLSLYDASGNPLRSAQFSSDYPNSVFGTTQASLNNVSLTPGSEYIIAVENNGSGDDPGIQINFAPSTVPLPSSLPLLGGALAMLGIARRAWRARA